jgi:pimeloyl-ACP methyl ester carboxylesterase
MSFIRPLKRLFQTFLISISVIACEAESETLEEIKGIDAIDLNDPWRRFDSHSFTFNAPRAKAYLRTIKLSSLASFVQYNVSVHRFTYQTKFKDSVVIASGAIAIPIGKENPSILVYHHGTMFSDEDTPSTTNWPSSWGMELTASNGYLVFLPDYIGYGTTKDLLHPYHLYRPTVDASIDMILAGKDFLNKNGVDFNDDGIFLAGFSEGGYAAFAVQKEIETHPELNIKLKASGPGAGAYDVAYQFRVTTDKDTYPGPGYMGLALSAYNEYYSNKPLTFYFNAPYAEKMMDLISGKYTEDYVHRQLPNRLSLLLEPAFLEAYRTEANHPFASHLDENNLNDFIVRTPTRFFHGTEDAVVPFVVAQKSYGDLINLGTNPDTLKLHPFDDGHDDIAYLQLLMTWFNSFE